MLDESTIWLVRLQGVGYARAEDMVNSGSGPNAAAGVNYDVRWAHPFCYDQVDWEPAVEKPTSVKGLIVTTAIVSVWKRCDNPAE